MVPWRTSVLLEASLFTGTEMVGWPILTLTLSDVVAGAASAAAAAASGAGAGAVR